MTGGISLPDPQSNLPPELQGYLRDFIRTIRTIINQLPLRYPVLGTVPKLPSATVAQLTANPAKYSPNQLSIAMCTDSSTSGLPIEPVYSDGTVWRRISDGSVIS